MWDYHTVRTALSPAVAVGPVVVPPVPMWAPVVPVWVPVVPVPVVPVVPVPVVPAEQLSHHSHGIMISVRPSRLPGHANAPHCPAALCPAYPTSDAEAHAGRDGFRPLKLHGKKAPWEAKWAAPLAVPVRAPLPAPMPPTWPPVSAEPPVPPKGMLVELHRMDLRRYSTEQ